MMDKYYVEQDSEFDGKQFVPIWIIRDPDGYEVLCHFDEDTAYSDCDIRNQERGLT